jgi:hypothetical protein
MCRKNYSSIELQQTLVKEMAAINASCPRDFEVKCIWKGKLKSVHNHLKICYKVGGITEAYLAE